LRGEALTADPNLYTTALTGVKLAFDTLRAGLSLLKDAKDALPPGDKAKAVETAIEQSEKQFGVAEAQMAQAFGYQLCKCQFPPVIMLTVGNTLARGKVEPGPVYECPKCGFNTAYPFTFARTGSYATSSVDR
jgi:hypothetical protein